MSVEKKKCAKCQSFEKVKLFDDLCIKFNNWCNAVQKPIALIHGCKLQEKMDDDKYKHYIFQYF
ncbi:MAG: hypothetical protein EAX96_14595 [Candidatus Lokiarchaeota archaeon]|nr:hypothetical protein [Candidatus Lokiarchaeota archaeon]